MVQGQTKGLSKGKSPNAASRHAQKAAAAPKKGKRYVAPKKTAAVKQAALHKGLSAKISKSIEQQVAAAASSGKLTIMKNVALEGTSAEKSKATKAKKP
ncbi:hypothetical protein GSI_15541 [Ganoderma sinense ZZ0214-1]|uniref:Uncharacterized protein n=1 Tax=Ganoderma sinense ZZ0214-1 TaxID=1077348 RepID=A0A2G8RMV9_9APHY|nr:hypothetical protein GSI_15541 [Ganoderma sinense ZZ0214-1]